MAFNRLPATGMHAEIVSGSSPCEINFSKVAAMIVPRPAKDQNNSALDPRIYAVEVYCYAIYSFRDARARIEEGQRRAC